MDIGNTIRFYRRKKGLSQKELAKNIHMTERTLSNYESGNRIPSIEILLLISDALSVTIDQLIHAIPIEKRTELKEDFLYFDWDHEKEQPVLHPLYESRENIYEEYVVCEMQGKIVVFHMHYVKKILQLDSINNSERCFYTDSREATIIHLHKKCKNNYFIIFETENRKWLAIGVDSCIEVRNYNSIFPRKESVETYVQPILNKLHFVKLDISIMNAKSSSDKLSYCQIELNQLFTFIKKNHHSSMIILKIKQLLNLFNELSKEERIFLEEHYQKSLQMFKEVNQKETELLKKIDDYVIPFYEVPKLLEELLSKVEQYNTI